ncbi:MAG TPA: hypothetical protein VFG00_06580 [Acidothermaceae bacterium]|nr:hypothetical protein [Acidothermaceae bacterium]
MIGILGPRDSVALAQQVAEKLGRSADMLTLAYQHVDEAIDLARSLEPMCEVLLFTGAVPFESAKRAGTWQCELDVIRHSQADLYRMIGLILKETGGKFPRVSVDSLDFDAVHRVFADMDLPIPEVIIPVVDEEGAFVFEDVEGTARAHLAALERGDVDAVLTCLDGTRRLLVAAGATTWRIDHAWVTIVEALRRAWLASEVKKTKGSSIAIALLKSEVAAGRGKSSATRASIDRAVATHARRMGSRFVVDDGRYLVMTTQAAIEKMLDQYRNGQKSLVDLATKPPAGMTTILGVGFGDTFATALDSAEKAFQISGSSHQPALVRGNGTVESFVDGAQPGISLQETSDAILKLAAQTGLGPLSLRRLIAALGRTDYTAVTAQQLAEFYGVMPRSARRMLGRLAAAGYAREAGIRGSVGAGRPHVLYDVDLPRLGQIIASNATGARPQKPDRPSGGRTR